MSLQALGCASDGDDRGSGGAGYLRLARHAALGGPVLAGEEVLVGSTRHGRARLTAYKPTGERRRLELPGSELQVTELAASAQAVAVGTGTVTFASARSRGHVVPIAFGPLAGPLTPFPARPLGIAVAGPLVISLERAARTLVLHDVASGGASRLLPAPAGASGLVAAGDFVAVIGRHDAKTYIAVIDLRSGAESYRVPAHVIAWGLGPDGRLVLVSPSAGGINRLLVATPQQPRLRTLARVALHAPRVAVARDSVAVARRAPGRLGEVVAIDRDGNQRVVTPAFARLYEFAYDGVTLAFSAGNCVYAGPVGGDPGPAPDDGCSDIAAELDFARLHAIGQVSGAAVRVPLRCIGPPVARCPALLRLTGLGFTVRRDVRIRPGLHEKRIRIPAAQRERAWRKGMWIELREPGGGSAGSAIPR